VNWEKINDYILNKAHIVIGSFCQGAILFMHWHYKMDISANVQQTVNWFYMFLAGHFGASQVWPDKGTKDDASGQH
jgi:hypothetical protein